MNPQRIITQCHWEITKNCNLSCIHCIAATGSNKILDKKQAFQAIDNLHLLGCKELYITGGEPLIRDDIFDILQRAKDKEIKIGLLTNSTLINKENINKIRLYVDELGISIEGSSSKINDQIRGHGSFNKVMKSIFLLNEYSISFSLYTTINKLNLQDLKKMVNLSVSLGANSIRFNEITLRGRAIKNKNDLALSKSDQDIIKKFLSDSSVQIHNNFKSDDKCDITPETIFLSPAGFIYPCIEIYQKKPSANLGNILAITPAMLLRYKKFYKNRNSSIKCPYKLLRTINLTFCLNNNIIKCPFG